MAANFIDYEACPSCDLLLKATPADIGIKAHCPRCGCLLYRGHKHSIRTCFALSLSALILFIPVNYLPLVGIIVLDKPQEASLWSGVSVLYREGFWAVALLVFIASVLFPLLKIILSLLISAHLYFERYHPQLKFWMRSLQQLDEWAMLEVYTLGIIVAGVKLASRTELKFGLGLIAFVVLLLSMVILSSLWDEHLFWRRIGLLNPKAQTHIAPPLP